MAHCVRVASQNLPPDQTASYPAQLDVKRRYEVGEWNVPCYSLRCVGFDMPLYDALHAAAVEISSRNKDAVAGVGSEPQSASAKRRLDDSVATVASSHASKRGRCSSQPTQEPVTVSEKPAGKD
jgi:hypothetical protein